MVKYRSVVVIEDEADIREVIEYNLQREGFRVICAPDGESGLRRTREESPDLVLLDLMMPGLDGVEVCRRLKENPLTRAIPVIMLTAKGEESDVILGLGLGADDYITKPFSTREVVARVKAVLRRGALREEGEAAERFQREGLVIDAGRHAVQIDDEPVSFTATELRLLHFLASHPGRVFTRDQLLDWVLGGE